MGAIAQRHLYNFFHRRPNLPVYYLILTPRLADMP